MRRYLYTVACIAGFAGATHASPVLLDGSTDTPTARAVMQHAQEGTTPYGQVLFTEGKHGLLAHISLSNVPKGWHAIHIHESGDCSGEGFKSAGGHAVLSDAHYSKSHGFLEHQGRHGGDMPNIWAHDDGVVRVDYFLPGLTIDDLMDEDGSAVIIHEGADDYASQPSGAAGARLSCGSIGY